MATALTNPSPESGPHTAALISAPWMFLLGPGSFSELARLGTLTAKKLVKPKNDLSTSFHEKDRSRVEATQTGTIK
jgi:hypothetical protein